MAKETAKDGTRIAKIGAYGAVAAAVLAALITGIFAVLKSDKSPAQTVNNSPCGIVTGTQINCNNPPGEPFPTTSQQPTGSGPWPFRTVNTWGSDGVDHGAVVRPCKDQECKCPPSVRCSLGVARGNTTVYARCQAHSTFTGVPGQVKDSVWFKVTWPNRKITPTTVYVPTAQDAFSGWILGSFLAPEGHNGNIPTCT
jgi:hypothetical protein